MRSLIASRTHSPARLPVPRSWQLWLWYCQRVLQGWHAVVGKTACLITRSSLLDGNGCFCQKGAERAAHVLDGHASRQLASSFCQKGAERAAHVAARRLKRSPSGISEIAHVSIEAFTGGQRWHWNDQSGKESLLSSPKEGRAKSVHVWTSLQHRPFFGRESHLPHDLMDVPSHKNHIACAEDS